jgi:hypothetical protein
VGVLLGALPLLRGYAGQLCTASSRRSTQATTVCYCGAWYLLCLCFCRSCPWTGVVTISSYSVCVRCPSPRVPSRYGPIVRGSVQGTVLLHQWLLGLSAEATARSCRPAGREQRWWTRCILASARTCSLACDRMQPALGGGASWPAWMEADVRQHVPARKRRKRGNKRNPGRCANGKQHPQRMR